MSFDAMWLHVLCHVAWCNAMSCDARSCNESSSVVPCNGTWCYELKMPLVVTSPCVVRSGSVTMWWSKELYYKVLQRTRVLLHTTKYYSSTTLYYKVFLQYYSVLLESTTPVLPCTTKYYSSTTLHYIVLLQYYSVLQRTIPVLPCTTKYYNILRHYYPALQSSMPVLLCTTKYYSITTLHYKVLCQHYYSSTTLHYKVLQHTTPLLPCPTKYYASTTLYYNVLLQYYSVLLLYYSLLQSTTPALLCTTKYYSVLQNTIPVLFCTTTYYSVLQSGTHDWSFTHMKGHLQCAEQQESSSNFNQIPPLPRKMNLMIDPHHIWTVIYNERSNRTHTPTSPNTAPATQNESHDWSCSHVQHHLHCAEQPDSYSSVTKYCACRAKWISRLIRVTYETSFTRRGAKRVDHPPASPNTAPATQNSIRKSKRSLLKTDETSYTLRGPIRAWLDHDQNLHAPARSPSLLFALRRRTLYWKWQHFALWLSTQI